jgi:hypothetical protein
MVFDGSRFEVSFDGVRITVEHKTFSGTGKTGFWKNADSVAPFDDFRIEKEELNHAVDDSGKSQGRQIRLSLIDPALHRT